MSIPFLKNGPETAPKQKLFLNIAVIEDGTQNFIIAKSW